MADYRINKFSYGGDTYIVANNVWYGTSSTGATTSAKTATTSSADFVLETGNMVFIKFTNGNTYNGTATLKVDNATAKDIATVGTTKTSRYHWSAGEVVGFVYDGTNFVMLDDGLATTTYYGATKLTDSTSSTSTSTAATPNSVKTAYDTAVTSADTVKVEEHIVGNYGHPTFASDTSTLSLSADTTGLSYTNTSSTATLLLGYNSTKTGHFVLFNSSNNYWTDIIPNTATANRTITLPDATGTVALTSDITTAVLTATDDGAGNVTLSVTGVTSANLSSASGVSF